MQIVTVHAIRHTDGEWLDMCVTPEKLEEAKELWAEDIGEIREINVPLTADGVRDLLYRYLCVGD